MSDNIYLDYRSSIDTLYFGLKFDYNNVLDPNDEIEKIKNYLFQNLFLKLVETHGNCFYFGGYKNDDCGIVINYEPRKNLLNDFCTIQLGGKFFRDNLKARLFLSYIFTEYGNLINIQRIDCALDCCYKEIPNYKDFTNNSGFPYPQFNKNYKYGGKRSFEVYSRLSPNFGVSFVNMIANGKGDVRLRVYDKDFEIRERKKGCYTEYYHTEEFYKKVFRIELQCRGRTLKGYLDKYLELYKVFDYDYLCMQILSYAFRKYYFEYIDNSIFLEKPDIRFSERKKVKDLNEQYKHAVSLQNSYYRKACDLVDKMLFEQELDCCVNKYKTLCKDTNDYDLYAVFKKYEILNGSLDGGLE